MLAENICVNIFLADIVVLRKAGAKTGGVEQCARAEHAVLGNTRNLGENIGQNVDRVCHDDINCVGSVFCDLGSDLLDDVGVDLGKLKTGLTCLTGYARGDNYNVGALCVGVGSGVDIGGVAICGALTDIHCLTEGLLFVDVDEDDLCRRTRNRKSVGDGCADMAGADNCYLAAHKIIPFL